MSSMKVVTNQEPGKHRRQATIAISGCALLTVIGVTLGGTAGPARAADPPAPAAVATFQKYCFQCHGKSASTAGINLEQLTSHGSPGENFQQWERVIAALDQNKMPPKGLPQPSDDQRHEAVTWVRSELDSFIKKHAGDPGRVTVRRLTSGEYAYTIQDLTGLTLDLGIDASSDSVGGEGFTNFGDVQFMQDANLERYLAAAKIVADHAVIGTAPLDFFADPGKTGFELSAITRIKDIYAANGFRTVSGEGGSPFGLEKYGKVFYAAWRYKHRAALGEANVTLTELAKREGVSAKFAQHIWTVVNSQTVGYPSSDAVSKWQKLPAPGPDFKATDAAVRAGCLEVQKAVTLWPSWFFARGDAAAGGAGDEDPLVFNDISLKAEATHAFRFNRGGGRGPGAGRGTPPPPGPATIYLNVDALNAHPAEKPVVIWRNAMVAYRKTGPGRGPAPAAAPVTPAPGGQTAADAAAIKAAALARTAAPTEPPMPLQQVLGPEAAAKLNFGKSPDGSQMGPNDFASEGSVSFQVPVPAGMSGFDLQVEASLGSDRNQVFRLLISDRDTPNPRGGKQNRALLADPQSAAYKAFRTGVREYLANLPPNSNSEPTPADKDPAPEPFDPTYNVPEHDDYIRKVKYIRDDRFVTEHLLDDATLLRLNEAWNDLFTSFEYHNNYGDLLAEKYHVDLKGKHLGTLTKAEIDAMPAEPRKYFSRIYAEYKAALAAEVAAQPGQVEDCLKSASRAWRRPLSEKEKLSLRAFYQRTLATDADHRNAIRALITRILVAPQFLYRLEQPAESAMVRPVANFSPAKPLTNWELSGRLSYFLWASIPDDELRRAAGAGELSNPQQLRMQVKRMLADPKARRLSTEFFGQWLGFYHFDQYKGVDTSRFPEFTQEVKESMYDEAVSFFEHVIRDDRPVRDLLYADYAYLNKPLAKYYGVKKEVKSTGDVERVDGATEFQRGGLLRLGAVLTSTSAPLRTSPVKRGDWILRRVLGTPVPPPPADAGSIPADDKLFGGLSVKDRLQAHKRNATCANCHSRMDPLGFSLEHYDSTGRWREQYPDGKPIEDSGTLSDKTEIAGVKGLLDYLQSKDALVRRTLSWKLLGYAFGRTVLASDQPLIEQMNAHGGDTRFSELVTAIVTSDQFRNHQTRQENPGDKPHPAPVKIATNLIRFDKAGNEE
ncbi:MAG: hypothetical protein QOJ99_985 [Bryobacterales bacterium]|nr:hypothetical protein [Bryobacterales bacterium]